MSNRRGLLSSERRCLDFRYVPRRFRVLGRPTLLLLLLPPEEVLLLLLAGALLFVGVTVEDPGEETLGEGVGAGVGVWVEVWSLFWQL